MSSSSGLAEAGFELPAKDAVERPLSFEGVKVAAWSPPQLTADCLGISTRQVRRLERKGLPWHGGGQNKRHPWPHVVLWYRAYARAKASEPTQVSKVSLEVALLEDRIRQIKAVGDHGHDLTNRRSDA